MKLFLICIAIWVFSLTSSTPAMAQPVLEVERPVATVLQPFQRLPEGEVMMIRITPPEGENFVGELEITPTDAVEFMWQCETAIQARLNGNQLRREGNRYITPISISANGEHVMMLRWRPEERAYAEPGRCDFLIDVRLLDTTRALLVEETDVAITLQVVPDTSLSIAGTSGTVNAERTFAFIDFGELETGETAYILFGTQANTDIDFTIESENQGSMVSLDDEAHRIPYFATFDGAPLSLASGELVRRRPEPTLNGSRYRLDIQIGDVKGAFAGHYQDNLTVEMVAQ